MLAGCKCSFTSQASCLLARMGHLGAKGCEARRRLGMAEEERARKEAEAFFAAHLIGRRRWHGRDVYFKTST